MITKRKTPIRLSGQQGNTFGKKEPEPMTPTPPHTSSDSIAETLVLVITGLGLAMDPPAFIGGLCMAVAGATLSRVFSQGQTRRRLIVTISAGVFVGILVALVVQSFELRIPPQFAMGVGGFLATFALPWVLKKAPDIAEKVVSKRPLP